MALERLSSTDEAFLAVEDRSLAMHVGAVLVLEGGGIVGADGAVDVERVRARVRHGISSTPRFAQRLCELKGLGTVWIDDARFDPDAHVIHTALPRPGGRAELMRLAGRLFAQPLDRRRPLWELWVVEGLEHGRYAIVIKAHHAMVDGVAGFAALSAMLSTEPSDDDPITPQRDTPPLTTPPRSRRALAAELARERAAELRHALEVLRERSPRALLGELKLDATGMARTLRDGLVPAPRTAINPREVGPHRGFTGVRLDLERVKHVKRTLGGTVNDVVLAMVAGGLRRYLARRGDDVDAFTRFRALVPVDLRARHGTTETMGNQVSLVLAPLPVHEPDAHARHRAVRETTEHLKHDSREIESTALVERIGDVIVPGLVPSIFRLAMWLRAFNVVVTNVVGPPMPLYLGPSRVLEMHALVPLFAQQGLAIAIVSYEGGLFVGLHTDPDQVPDGDEVARDLLDAFEELAALASKAEETTPQDTERSRAARPT